MSAAIVRDTTVSALGQKEHLVFEGIRGERPAVAEDDGLPRAPVLVIEIDWPRVFLADSDVWHFWILLIYFTRQLGLVVEVDALRPKRR